MSERKYTFICRDGWIRSKTFPHGGGRFGKWFYHTPKMFSANGEPSIRFQAPGGKEGIYHLRGKSYPYNYYLLREFVTHFWHPRQYVGRQMIWIEGNPTALNFNDDQWKTANKDLAFILEDVLDSDAPLKFLRPTPIPWGMIAVIGAAMLFAGLGIGQYLASHH